MDRPSADAGDQAYINYVYYRENPTGVNHELWLHEFGCRSWIVAERNMSTHEFLSTQLASECNRGAK